MRRTLIALAALGASLLLIDRLAAARRPKVGQWRSRAGFESYRGAYDEVMATIPDPSGTRDVATEFGTVRVYEWAAADAGRGAATPVVLLPGIRSGAPMWGENLTQWIGRRTVYAMDAIGDSGMSTHAVPFTSFEDQAAWVEQALAGLGLGAAHVVGHSFGGAIAATHALRHPARVASLTLLEPVMVLRPMPASIYLWATLLLLPVPQSWKDWALAGIGGVSVEEVRERTPMSMMVDEGSKHYAAVTLSPRTLTDAEWHSLPMPVRVDLAADKSMAGGSEAARRARAIGIGSVTIWPQTTHSLPMQVAKQLGPELERYWDAHDG
ncbi:alpha/beta fold hydrolase [Agromyces laixinhei]|uniref:alpha/beta fold hydrolase n=1 Tax=Agromyces laixinhei TaxID=2585717 RepID=UPI001116B144|nr:alpha/beta hydrolase [Agromyces laixinhei]